MVPSQRFNFLPEKSVKPYYRSIAPGTWYNVRVQNHGIGYKKGAQMFYFAQTERTRDQKELSYTAR